MKVVRDYMAKDIISVSDQSLLRRVIQVMSRHRMCAVPVVDQLGEYKGCVSESDILSAAMPTYLKSIVNTSFLANIDLATKHLSKILDRPTLEFTDSKYPTVDPNESLSFAADLLFRSKRTVIPVVKDKTVVGLFSRLDFLSISLSEDG